MLEAEHPAANPNEGDDRGDDEFLEALGQGDGGRAARALLRKPELGPEAIARLASMLDPDETVSSAYPLKLVFKRPRRGRPQTLDSMIGSHARARKLEEQTSAGKSLKTALYDVGEATGKSRSTLLRDWRKVPKKRK